MPYTFSLVMGGLCLFAVDRDKGVVRALMVQTDKEKIGKKHDGLVVMKEQLGHEPELHAPVLIYPFAALAGVSPQDVGERDGQWLLDGEEISIEVAAKTPLEVVGNLKGQKSGRPQGLDKDFTWVPELKDVAPAAGHILPDCLADNPKQGYLSARVRIDHGSLKVDQFAAWKGNDVLVDFAPAAVKLATRVIPHRVTWRIQVPDEPGPAGTPIFGKVAIKSRKFGSTAVPTTILTFQPTTIPAKGAVEILLVNLCCGNYLSREAPEPKTLDPDTDFLCFYMLLDNFAQLAAKNALPIPVGAELVNPAAQGGGVSGINCSMARVTIS